MSPGEEKLPKINRFKRGTGLVIVYYGCGKGKTTAALGLALRAAGYNLKVLIIQFIKGTWLTGEMESLKKLTQIELVRTGEGFVGIIDDHKPQEDHAKAAKNALELSKTKIQSGNYDVVILDEILGAVSGGLLKTKDLLGLIKINPEYTDLIFTGRHAPKKLIEKANLVTEMQEIKHPFQQGLFAKRGIDY